MQLKPNTLETNILNKNVHKDLTLAMMITTVEISLGGRSNGEYPKICFFAI